MNTTKYIFLTGAILTIALSLATFNLIDLNHPSVPEMFQNIFFSETFLLLQATLLICFMLSHYAKSILTFYLTRAIWAFLYTLFITVGIFVMEYQNYGLIPLLIITISLQGPYIANNKRYR